MSTDLYFDDEEHADVELLPESEYERCAREMGLIEDFGVRRRSDAGWDAVHVRSASDKPLLGLAIGREALRETLTGHLTPAGKVEIRYPYPAAAMDGYYTAAREFLMFVEFEDLRPQRVKLIHAYADPTGDADFAAVESALGALTARWPLILADWRHSEIVRLTDQEALRAYLERLVG